MREHLRQRHWILAIMAGMWAGVLGLAALGLGRALAGDGAAALPEIDTALIVSVDVSNSVDAKRYKLQMEGIAEALEDPTVIQAITSGPQGAILFSMVTWADRPQVAIPWQKIGSAADAAALAKKVRSLPRFDGEFTCVSRMMRTVSDKMIPQIPGKPSRIVVDVSGDGRENCNPEEPLERVREELVEQGVTINGLPILEGDEGETLESWYRENVMGGLGAFVLPADGFKDFGRAIRQKFMIEISGTTPAGPKKS